jgi:outer membrane protein
MHHNQLVKPTSILVPVVLLVALAVSTRSQTPVAPAAKIAVFDMQAAIANTHDGRQTAANLQAKYDALKERLEKKQADVQALQDKLRKGGTTMNDEARAWLEHEIDSGTRSVNHDAEDLQAEAGLEQAAAGRSLQVKMLAEVEKYAGENGYTAVLDIGAPQNQVLWSSPSTNITQEIVNRYEKSHPAPTSAPNPHPAAGK